MYPTTAQGVAIEGATTGTSIVLNKPSGLPDNSLLLIKIRGQGTATGATAASSTGFTAVHAQGNADRIHMMLYKTVTTASGEPSTYTVNTNGTSGRIVASIEYVTGVDLASPIAGFAPYQAINTTNPGTLNSFTVDSSTAEITVVALFSDERTSGQSHVPSAIPSGFTTDVNIQSTKDSSTTGSRTGIWSGHDDTTGSTTIPSMSLTWPTGVTSVKASAVALRGATGVTRTASGTVTLSGTADVVPVEIRTATGTFTLSGTATGTSGSSSSLDYITAVQSTGDQTVYTLSGTSIGAADPERYIILTLGGRSTSQSDASVTLAGVTMTPIQKNTAGSGSSWTYNGLYILKVPTGTTATIVATFDNLQTRAHVGLWRAVNINPTPVDSNFATSSLTLNSVAGGYAVASLSSIGTATDTVWTGLTEDWDVSYESNGAKTSGAHGTTSGSSLSFSLTGAGTTPRLTGATFVPMGVQETRTATGTLNLSGTAPAFASFTRTATSGITLSGSATALSSRLGFSSVTQFLATPGATVAWRLGGGPYPQHSEYAGDQSVLLGYGALEFSTGWTSDLVPFGLGPQYLDTIAGVSGNVDPTTMTWATLSSTYVNKNNPVSPGVFQPFYKLEDALAKYTPTHVMLVDPKYGFDTISKIDVMLDLCDAYGGPSKIIIKFDSPTPSTNLVTRAHARGYHCINYWGTDTTSLASQQSIWDSLGISYSASSGVWTTAKSYGKPVWAAVVPDQTGYNTAWTNSGGFNFANVSGVTSVTPVSAGPLANGTITLSGSATTQVVVTASGTVTLSGTASVFEREITTATGTVALSGTAVPVEREIAVASGTVTLSGTAVGIEQEVATATSGITLSGTATVFEREITAGVGTLVLTGSATAVIAVTATGAIVLSGNADGESAGGAPTRTATGTFVLGGSATALVREITTATGTFALGGTALTTEREIGTAVGALVLTGVGVGVAREIRTASGTIVLSGTALFSETVYATATGVFTVTGAAVGVKPSTIPVPDVRTLKTAPARILKDAGKKRTVSDAGTKRTLKENI